MFQSFVMGIGLAMDASCVSMTNGLTEKNMKITKIIFIAFLFGVFQMLMPVLGYFAGGLFSHYIQKFIPLIALIVLSILGGKMIIETLRERKHNKELKAAKSQAENNEKNTENQENVISDEIPSPNDISQSTSELALCDSQQNIRKIKAKEIIIQAIATSIDAFSIGVLYIEESIKFAMLSFMIFGLVTIALCIPAVFIGKKFGTLFKDKAGIIGGLILVAIGLKIFIEYLVETL